MSRLEAYWKTTIALDGGLDDEVPLASKRQLPRHSRFQGTTVWIHDAGHHSHAFVTEDGHSFIPDNAVTNVQFERYVPRDTASAARTELMRHAYYALKPLMPRPLQLVLQRANARSRLRKTTFPGWPQDDSLRVFMHAVLGTVMRDRGLETLPFIGFWPRGKHWAGCFTHDVETSAGFSVVDQTAAIEEKHNIRSTWFIVPERYQVPMEVVDDLRARGHEIGVHGLNHDGRLFSSEEEFERRLPRINHYIKAWGAVGFRSPALYRNAEWIPRLNIQYDSSFIDTAVLEPQFGGVSTVHPYQLDDRVVELPITMPMDHHLINLLRRESVRPMLDKFAWVIQRFGLANFLYHPDYNLTDERLRDYEAVVAGVTGTAQGWVTTARDIADWWRRRHASTLVKDGDHYRIEGPAAADGTIWRARRTDGGVQVEPSV